MQRANSLEETLMLGKIEGRRRRGQQKQKILTRGGKNTQKNGTKEIFMTQIIMMV